MPRRKEPTQWVLLCYRMPREPSTPRIGIWRQLERLGVARLGDGLVGLPADAATREQIDWIAEEIRQADGTATVWLATAASTADEAGIVDGLRTARAAEYQGVIGKAEAAAATDADEKMRALRLLREELRRIARRDFFPSSQRDQAKAAVEALVLDARAPGKRARVR
jgi:hypothetical protein